MADFRYKERRTEAILRLQASESEVIRLYVAGTSLKKLATKYDTWTNTIFNFIRRRGVSTRSKSQAMKICWSEEDRLRMSRQRTGRPKKKGARWSYDRFIAKPRIRGSKNGMWKGGTKKLQGKIRQCEFYSRWRAAVFVRDNYTCRRCGRRGGRINADHVIAFSTLLRWYEIKSVEQAAACSAFWNTDNGRTLCLQCHKKTDNYAGKSLRKNG